MPLSKVNNSEIEKCSQGFHDYDMYIIKVIIKITLMILCDPHWLKIDFHRQKIKFSM